MNANSKTDTLNLYGDKLIPTTGQHGANISEQRTDELDQACLDYVRGLVSMRQECRVLDIGGGSGSHSKRCAALGASVTLIDLTDQRGAIEVYNASLSRQAIQFIQKDVRDIADKDWVQPIHCVYSQRMLGCLPYHDTLSLLKRLVRISTQKAHFYLSTGGLDTEYGRDYPDRDKPVEQRFAHFSKSMAEKHGIWAPECLYRESDLRHAAEQSGLVVLKSWTSPFGNPKVIARVPS